MCLGLLKRWTSSSTRASAIPPPSLSPPLSPPPLRPPIRYPDVSHATQFTDRFNSSLLTQPLSAHRTKDGGVCKIETGSTLAQLSAVRDYTAVLIFLRNVRRTV